MFRLLSLIMVGIGIMSISVASTGSAKAATAENTIYMDVSSGGRVAIELLPDIAPKHVERIKKLTREGFYDGIIFHRVISGFMAQTGDPTGTGMGSSKYPDVPAEFNDYVYKRGTVGMARSMNPNSANSQFFICFDDTGCRGLTGQYTVFGQVTSGMEYIDNVAVGEPPAKPSKIVKMVVAADIADAGDSADADDDTSADADASSAGDGE